MASASITTAARARKAGFPRDTASVAGRALRSVLRDPEVTIPALVIPVFMFVVTVGALKDFAERIPGLDYLAFQLPVAVMFAVTGVSRAITVVTDIQSGYFDRLVITPVNRLALLLGFLVADFALVVALTVPVIIMGFIVGISFKTGPAGIAVFMLMSGLWGLIFAGFPYAIALKTGNPAAVNISFLLFFPFLVHDHPVRAARSHDRLAWRRCRLQSGHLPVGGAAFPDLRRMGAPGLDERPGGHSQCWRRQHRAGPGGAQEPRNTEIARRASC